MSTTEPYVIRGHHLDIYAGIVSDQLSPEQAANRLRLDVINCPDAEYVADVMGEDSITIDRTVSNLTEAFDRFAKLDSQDPVKITFGEIDAICACCAIGRHCSAGRSDKLRVGSRVRDLSPIDIDDQCAIAKFNRIAKHLGAQGVFEFKPTRDPDFDKSGVPAAQNAPIAYREPLITTAFVARAVLSQWISGRATQAA